MLKLVRSRYNGAHIWFMPDLSRTKKFFELEQIIYKIKASDIKYMHMVYLYERCVHSVYVSMYYKDR